MEQYLFILPLLSIPIFWILYRAGLLFKSHIAVADLANPKVGARRKPEIIFTVLFPVLLTVTAVVQPWQIWVPMLFLFLWLMPAMATDIEEFILPDKFTYPAIGLALLASFLFPALHFQETHLMGLLQGTIGLVVGFGIMYGLAVLAYYGYGKDAVGGGDLKLMTALGALLGWQATIFILCFGSIVGSIIALASGKDRKKYIPFGPSIMIAAGVWYLIGYQFMSGMGGILKNIFDYTTQ